MKCVECGKHEDKEWSEPTRSKMIERQQCFNCNFWTDLLKEKNSIRISGEHYMDGGSGKTWNGFKGFDGRLQKILMNDGRNIETDNLWYQGKIPEHFKARLPDNAEFVKEPKRKGFFPASRTEPK